MHIYMEACGALHYLVFYLEESKTKVSRRTRRPSDSPKLAGCGGARIIQQTRKDHHGILIGSLGKQSLD